MDEIIITLRRKLNLRLLRRLATRLSYVGRGEPFFRGDFSLSWLTPPFLVVPMLFLCAGLTLAPEHAEAAGATYTATDVGAIPAGSTRVVRAVNDSGEVVGTVTGDHGIRAFFLHGGVLQEIAGLPTGSDYSTAFGINNRGQVVGSMNTATGMHAFRSMRATGIVDLKTLPGDTSSAALAINTSGKAAGWSSGPTGVRAVTWSPAGAIQALPILPDSNSCRGLAINDNNDVAGVCETASGPHAVLWAGGTGTAKDLGTLPGGFESAVLSINNNGDIVGSSGDTEGEHHAALWPGGGRGVQNLGTLPNRISSQALAINNRNEVVGVSAASGDGGDEHAFLWTERDGIQDLNDLLTPNSGFVLTHAIAINAQGHILAIGHDEITHSADKSHEGHDLPLRIFLLSGPVGGP